MEHETNDNSEMFGLETPPAGAPERPATWAEQEAEEGEVFELLESGPKKTPKLKSMLAAGLAVVVLGAGSMVAMRQFQSADTAGSGAASPDAAVAQFFDSLSNEDFLGAAELMEPTERRTMLNPGIEMMGELQRLGIMADDMDLGSVPGIDMQFENMTYVPQSLGGGGNVVRVQVNGTFTGTGDASMLPYGSLITDNLPAETLAELTAEGEEAMETSVESIEDLGLVTVQRDGEWYVSLWYSIAEGIRLDSGVEGLPAFGQGPTPTGGETPEDTIWALATAAENLDLSAMIGALDPQEAAALYDYANLFLPEAQREIDDELGGDSIVEFSRIDMRSETDGDDGQVWVDGFAVDYKNDDGHITIDTGADCMVMNHGDGYCEISKSDMDEMGLGVASMLPTSSAVRVHRVDGQWYLSPMASMMQPMLEQVRELERDQLQGWIDNPETLFEEDGALAGLGFLPLAILGTRTTASFEEVTSAVNDGWEDEWETSDEWDVPPVPTTVGPDGFFDEGFFDDEEPLDDGSAGTTTTSVPAFSFGTETTVPPTTVPDTTAPQTSIPGTTIPQTTIPQTTVAPTTTVTETVVIFRVLEASPAGTSAFSILAEPVEVSPEEAASYVGALTEEQAPGIEGWVTLIDVEPGDVLRFEWFIDE